MKKKYPMPPKKRQAKRKLSKSTKAYIFCGLGAAVLIIGMLLLWALINNVDIIAWFGTKYAGFLYLAIILYVTIGIILFVKDKIARM